MDWGIIVTPLWLLSGFIPAVAMTRCIHRKYQVQLAATDYVVVAFMTAVGPMGLIGTATAFGIMKWRNEL